MIVVASLGAVAQSCRTPLLEIKYSSRKPKKEATVRIFTSLQLFHTHAPPPRGHFVQQMHWLSISSYMFPEAGCFNESNMQGKNAIQLAGLLRTSRKFVPHLGANRRYPISLPCPGPVGQRRICDVFAKWLARWAKSPAVNTWIGLAVKSSRGFSSFSGIAALESLSLMRMLWRTVASWWTWLGIGNVPMLAVIGSLSSISDSGGTSQHCQTVAGNCAKRFFPHVLQGCWSDDASNWQAGVACSHAAVYVSIFVCSHITNNAIEEEFRLTVPLYSPAIDFRHHKAIGTTCLVRWQDLLENVSMKNSMLLLDFSLQWIRFPLGVWSGSMWQRDRRSRWRRRATGVGSQGMMQVLNIYFFCRCRPAPGRAAAYHANPARMRNHATLWHSRTWVAIHKAAIH